MSHTLQYRRLAATLIVQGLCLSALLSNATPAERRAVLIGIDEYKSEGHLEFCGKDQSALKDRLERAGFDPLHVRLLHDQAQDPAMSPTKSNIESAIERTCQEARKGDLILVSFSGHGREIESRGYLCPLDGALKQADSMIAASWIYQKLASSPADLRIVMLDACREADGLGDGQSLAGELPTGVMLFNSCSKGEVSIEDKENGHGIYLHFLAEGLRGLADQDLNGQVTLGELAGFVERETPALVEQQFAKRQHPLAIQVPKSSFVAKSRLDISDSGIYRLDSFRGEFVKALKPLMDFINDYSRGPVTVEIGPIVAASETVNFSSGIAGRIEERLKEAFRDRGITCVLDGKGDSEWVISGSYTNPSGDEPSVQLKLEVRRRSDHWVRDFNFVVKSTADVGRIMGVTVALPDDKNGNSKERRKALKNAIDNPTVAIKDSRVSASGTPKFMMQVQARSQGKTEFKPVVAQNSEGQATIDLKPGDEFELVLINESDDEVAAAVTIDGLSVFHFSDLREKGTGEPQYNYYIIEPKGETIINGWHIHNNPPGNYQLFEVQRYCDLKGHQPTRGKLGVITASFAKTKPKDTLGVSPSSGLVTVPGKKIDVPVRPVSRGVDPPLTFISLRYSR